MWTVCEADILFVLQLCRVALLVERFSESFGFYYDNAVCEIPRIFERTSPSDFRTQGSFFRIRQ